MAGLLQNTGCGGTPVTPTDPDVEKQLDGYMNLSLLTGDIHVHTRFSDGQEIPNVALQYAKETAGLDFCCITDHAETFVPDGPQTIADYRAIQKLYDVPGQFSVLFGYEWTNTYYGHRNVYSPDNDIPIYPFTDPSASNVEDLWKRLEGHNLIVVPHHPMIASTRLWWEFYNPEMEPIVEFYSKWGLSLRDGNPRPLPNPKAENAVFNALKAGRRYGLIAGTDTHRSKPGSRLFEDWPVEGLWYSQPGMVCVWAGSNSRNEIFNALKNRRCYGLTGSRVNMMFSVNKALMGSEIKAQASPQMAFKVSSDIAITQVTILKIANGTVSTLKTYTPDSAPYSRSYVDSDFSADSAYALMVDLENTDMALSSPVWVTKG